jgi:hypothetical protein
LEAAMDIMERGQLSLKKVNKFWHILVTSLLDHLNGKTKSRKQGPQGVLTNQEDEALCGLDFGNARMWTFNHLALVQNKSSITNTNQAHPFQEWNSHEFLMALVQMLTSKVKYLAC